MPLPHTAKLPPPKSEDEFEDLCVEALRLRWKAEPQRNGRRGQRQHGVDIFASPTPGQFVAAQCKNMESVELAVVQHESTLARGFQPGLTAFIVMLSGPRDAKLQSDVRVHYNSHPEAFTVSVLFWDDIVGFVTRDQDLVLKYWPTWHVPPVRSGTSAPSLITAPSTPVRPATHSPTPPPTASVVERCPEPVDAGSRAALLAGLAEPRIAPPTRVVHVWPFSAPEGLIREREVEPRTVDAMPQAHGARDALLLPRELAGRRFEDGGVVWREQLDGSPAINRTLAVGSDGSVAFSSVLWEAHHPQLPWGGDGVGVGSCIDVLVGTLSIARQLVLRTGRTPRLWVVLSLHGVEGRRFVQDGEAASAAPLMLGVRSAPIPRGCHRAAGQLDLATPAADVVPMLVEMAENVVYKTGWRPPRGYLEQRARRALSTAGWV